MIWLKHLSFYKGRGRQRPSALVTGQCHDSWYGGMGAPSERDRGGYYTGIEPQKISMRRRVLLHAGSRLSCTSIKYFNMGFIYTAATAIAIAIARQYVVIGTE